MGTEIVKESLVKYLSGLLDADGSLSFTFRTFGDKTHIGLVLSLASSDAVDKGGFVSSLPQITGMGSVYRYGASQQFVAWRIFNRADLEMLLPRLIKHMVIKAKHWQWMLEVWREGRGTILTLEEKGALAEDSRQSRRSRVGPLKPKNHPSWAWLAGYLDGDGTYHYRHYRTKADYNNWNIAVSAVAHVNDASVLHFLCGAFGGVVRGQGQSDNVLVWYRSLGYRNRSFAEGFLPNLAKHSRLKRNKIDAILHHHRQRLSTPGTERTFCSEDGCGRAAHGHRLCSMHYQRERRLGRVSDSLSAAACA